MVGREVGGSRGSGVDAESGPRRRGEGRSLDASVGIGRPSFGRVVAAACAFVSVLDRWRGLWGQ